MCYNFPSFLIRPRLTEGLMFSRRTFLTTGTLAAGATALAQRTPAAPATDDALPPSIARLKSMRDQARPITVDERRARLDRARELMQQNRLDAIMVMGGTSLVY